MNKEIYHLGAVVEYFGMKLLVIGYDFLENDDHLKLAYKVVPFPRGFIDKEKLIEYDKVNLIRDGYSSDITDRFVQGFDMLGKTAEHLTVDEMKEILLNVLVNNEEKQK